MHCISLPNSEGTEWGRSYLLRPAAYRRPLTSGSSLLPPRTDAGSSIPMIEISRLDPGDLRIVCRTGSTFLRLDERPRRFNALRTRGFKRGASFLQRRPCLRLKHAQTGPSLWRPSRGTERLQANIIASTVENPPTDFALRARAIRARPHERSAQVEAPSHSVTLVDRRPLSRVRRQHCSECGRGSSTSAAFINPLAARGSEG